ncbi:MAG: glycosyl transferase, partial [Bacteroidaceae bacterium]|nr:glycosyl transferase [Bacteroidaceae bacterium]
DHQQTGYVATYQDAQDFANGILWTLSADYDTLSRQARNKAMVTYSENTVAHQYIKIYKSL